MAYCPRCGSENIEGAAFCRSCGGSMELERRAVRPEGTKFDRAFKGAGPLLKTFIAFIIVLLVIEVLDALSDESRFADRFGEFLMDNLLLIFLVLLVMSYSGYASRRYHREHSFVAPLIAAVIIAFMLWVVANVFDIIGSSQNVDEMRTVADLMLSILYIIFLLVLLIGYIGVVMRADEIMKPQAPPASYPPAPEAPPAYQAAPPAYGTDAPRRMGRSSRDKVLFGVCGGMAEYLNADPFIIRVLWVVGAFLSFGAVLLAYLILALVLPQNP